MTPTTVNRDAASAEMTQPHPTGHGSSLLTHHGAMPVELNNRLVQHLNDISDAVLTITEQSQDTTAAVDEAVTRVVTELDHIIFEAHMFLSRLGSSPAPHPRVTEPPVAHQPAKAQHSHQNPTAEV
ncbi:hypothetical protein [Nocardia sp. NPDC049149]|uniref:hypothetical protein n=1 Tax=Nocardia sp. NPDC049149 TaxID=3364315 RepID=UPI00372166F9